MQGIEIIRDLLAQSVKKYNHVGRMITCEEAYLQFRPSRQTFEMEETDPSATLKKIYVTSLPDDSMILKPDNFGVRFFKSGTWNKACDYLFLVRVRGDSYAIFIELKSSLNDMPDSFDNRLVIVSNEDRKKEMQLLGGEALFDYIKVIAEKHSSPNDLSQYKTRMWVLYESIRPRSPTRAGIMLTAQERIKSNKVLTKKVHDAQTISIEDLI